MRHWIAQKTNDDGVDTCVIGSMVIVCSCCTVDLGFALVEASVGDVTLDGENRRMAGLTESVSGVDVSVSY